MQTPPRRRQPSHTALLPVALLLATSQAFALDSYNPATRQLSIPALTIGTAAYSNVVLTVGSILSGPSGTAPAATTDSYSPATNQLTVPSVAVGSRTYYNVVAQVAGLVSIGGVSGADSYNGTDLTVAGVQANGVVYRNVVVSEALNDVIRVGGGMPTATPDTYNPATNRLAIPAVQVGGRVYTNVVISAGQIEAIGGVTFRNQESIVHSFLGVAADGINPTTTLIQGNDANFYGTTPAGGANNVGAVYKVTPAGVETLLYSFGRTATDGAFPAASLVQGNDGNFYGTTSGGGANGYGTVFKVTMAGVETVLYSFSGGTTDGRAPSTALIQGSDGNFYGTTQAGGASGYGTIYKVTPAGIETVLYSFGSVAGDGRGTPSALTQDSQGNFYGTTDSGGSHGQGTVFKLTPSGTASVLYSFGASLADANTPFGGITLDADGNLYGTGYAGGSFSGGAIFKITPAGVETIPYSFGATGSDGTQPQGPPTLGNDGNFYGITQGGGDNLNGAVYQFTSTGTEAVIYSFGSPSTVTVNPSRTLIQGNDGNLYATIQVGGTYNYGAAVKISTAGAESTLYSFGNGTGDGTTPSAGLIQGSDGNFYGTSTTGGAYNSGTLYKTSAAGVETVLYSFGSGPTDATAPVSLIQGSDGNFYGTALSGGANGGGALFKVTPAGAETLLYSFGSGVTDGNTPEGSLIQGSDGNFYGTTVEGGANGGGTVYQVTPAGVENVLYAFGSGATDGVNPEGGLVQGTDGNFYGTTVAGGMNGVGTVFKLTPAGTETQLHSFSTAADDGSSPAASLIQGSDGNFYGETPSGGAFSGGTIFKVTPAGAESVLYSLGNGTTDGNTPAGALVIGSDDNFYGVTSEGGSHNAGTLFKVTPTGVETVLVAFGSGIADGTSPTGALVQGSDGKLYGSTTTGGTNANGAIFALTTVATAP